MNINLDEFLEKIKEKYNTKMEISEFLEWIDDIIHEFIKFIKLDNHIENKREKLSKNNVHKKISEEAYPIKKFLLAPENNNKFSRIQLTGMDNETKNADGKLWYKNPNNHILIEVTKIITNGKGEAQLIRYLDQGIPTGFIFPGIQKMHGCILEAINKKNKKEYQKNTILLISLGDSESQAIRYPDSWNSECNKLKGELKTKKLIFKEIWLGTLSEENSTAQIFKFCD